MNLLKCPAPELNGLVWSPVESVFLERSGHASMYSNEKIPTVEVLNIYELGTVLKNDIVLSGFIYSFCAYMCARTASAFRNPCTWHKFFVPS